MFMDFIQNSPWCVKTYTFIITLPKPFMAVLRVLASSSALKFACAFTVPSVGGSYFDIHQYSMRIEFVCKTTLYLVVSHTHGSHPFGDLSDGFMMCHCRGHRGWWSLGERRDYESYFWSVVSLYVNSFSGIPLVLAWTWDRVQAQKSSH